MKLVDAPGEGIYPMPMLAANEDAVLVGRVREDRCRNAASTCSSSWRTPRKGAATNALQIARLLAEEHL